MNFEPYSFCFGPEEPPMAMDKRHIEMLHDLAMEVPIGGTAIEIGCHKGASTAAFIEALNNGRDFTLHLVDPVLTKELERVIAMCSKPDRIQFHKMFSLQFRMPKKPDLVMIDGDHRWPALVDVYHALEAEAKVIAMHDVASHAWGIPTCYGAYLAAGLLANESGRTWWKDVWPVPGEWTHRGFAYSKAK